jgi:aminopeptidase N
MNRRNRSGPIWLGTRAFTSTTRQDYQLAVYQKGAWVLHMLRYLMLDIGSGGEDRFKQMMRDFYQTYRGGRASTEDFQAMVERYTGTSMDWFFDQWVYGTGIPTYEWSYTTSKLPTGRLSLRLRVRQREVPEGFTMPVPVRLDFGSQGDAIVRVLVQGPITDYEAEIPAEPSEVTFNAFDGVLAEVKSEKWRG